MTRSSIALQIDELIVGTAIEGLDLLPSAPALSGAEVELVGCRRGSGGSRPAWVS